MAIETGVLTDRLKPVVRTLVDDMRSHLRSTPEDVASWRAEFDAAKDAERVGVAYDDWEDEQLNQAAVGWVVTTVFVRFIEDNALFGEDTAFLSGYSEELREAARFYEQKLYRAHPELSYRGYLEACFHELGKVPATESLVDEHAAFNIYSPTNDGAKVLVEFWRQIEADTGEALSLHDENLDTRFLGDLYENLSEYAQKKYALRQTPEFVEEFILDRTLIPALKDRPLEGFKLIDPTCGSGHFLIGAFRRIFGKWRFLEPAGERRVHAEKAMSAIHGVDINPFAVAITKFRLLVEYLQALEEHDLYAVKNAPFQVLAGDTLLFGSDSLGRTGFDMELNIKGRRVHTYSTEDRAALDKVLTPQAYDVVVGNPPYITPKDPQQNKTIRERYKLYCKGTYALTVPFMVKFFRLAKGEESTGPIGWVGQITSNSFMQREFGKPMIELFFKEVELRDVVDSSGAYIPGHGTPTVILVGRNTKPKGSKIRGVLGIQGEPGVPENAEDGRVWQSIVKNIDNPGFENPYVTIADLTPEFVVKHPWNLEGGAASEVSELIEAHKVREIGDNLASIGRTMHTGLDPAYFLPGQSAERKGIRQFVPLITGKEIRDFRFDAGEVTLFPFDSAGIESVLDPALSQHFWLLREKLRTRDEFGSTPEQLGKRWFDPMRFHPERFVAQFGIAFAFVATHNHFVLDRGGKVFNRSAPVIKLPEGATEADHLELLGVLNSSVAAFWLRQNSHNKGSTTDSKGARTTLAPWEDFYEFTGTTLKRFPLPAGNVTDRARRIDSLAQELDTWDPANLFQKEEPSQELIAQAKDEYARIRELMIAEQEELDWATYALYGILEEDLSLPVGEVAGIVLGQRAFEIDLARDVESGEIETAWFERHHSTPITDVPSEWEERYQAVVEKRLDLIANDRFINLLERPEYKRRWASDTWEEKVTSALQEWLLDKLETPALWFSGEMPRPRSIGELAGQVEGRADFSGFVDVLRLWSGKRDASTLTMLTALLKSEAVPYLKEHRYKKSGLRKREAWEKTWQQQREEDAGPRKTGDVDVPPNYTSTDMYPDTWRHRGKLDVPKERFIAFPGAGPEDDPTPMIGWAGWNYLQQGLAIYLLFDERLEDDAPLEAKTAILNGLQQVLPWIMQWHNELDPDTGEKLGDYLTSLLHAGATRLGVAVEDLHNYVPPRGAAGRKKKTAKKEN